MSKREVDVVVVGGGVAGAAIGYFLRRRGVRNLVVLEAEAKPAYHASGRSAAALVEIEADEVVQAMLSDAAAFLRAPPDGFADGPLLDRTGIVSLFDERDRGATERMVARANARGAAAEIVDVARARALFPALADGDSAGAVWLPDSGRIAVDRLLAGYLANVDVRCDTRLTGIDVHGGRVRAAHTSAGVLPCRWIVNAAGAWAGEVAKMAGAVAIELRPLRRTIVTFDPPGGIDARGWPLLAHDERLFYVAPEAGGLIVSPMDATPSAPCDAQPESNAIAEGLDKLRAFAPSLAPGAHGPARAGLRTFAPDRRLVLGPDPRVHGFFWLAGQGGCGIETSPCYGRVASEVLTEGASSWAHAEALSPDRFA